MYNVGFQTEDRLIKELEKAPPMTFEQLAGWMVEKHPRTAQKVTTNELRQFTLENGIKVLN